MARPKKNRRVAFESDICYFKPRGIPLVELDEVRLTVDERESIRLADLYGLSYETAGKLMGVSRATFGRIVQNARKNLADALINGKSIRIEGGNYTIVDEPRVFTCDDCSCEWEEPCGTGKPEGCPECKHANVRRVLGKPSNG